MNRFLALILNVVVPGTGLLLRRPGWTPAIAACLGMAGLTLFAVAWLTQGTANTIPLGWFGLGMYLAAALSAGLTWLSEERPSSRDLKLIQPLFQDIARHYLRNDLPAAELTARRLVNMATSEPGAWRLLGLVLRARGANKRAVRAEKRAERLAQARD